MIRAGRADVIWTYVGTLVSMGSGFALLPFLISGLSETELGLWYIFLAISNLTQLMEFGFNPAFARNIVYCLSGSDLSSYKETRDGGEVDWHLVKVLFSTTRVVYTVISAVALLVISTVGTAYIALVTSELSGITHWIAWIVICLSIFLNLYYLKYLTYLRGTGDVESENKARTVSKLAQLLTSAILLMCGGGLIGAAFGFFVGGLSLRLYAAHAMSKKKEISEALSFDMEEVARSEVKEVLKEVSSTAWKDGVVQISVFSATQATSILSSMFLTLAETGIYSLSLQLGSSICALSLAYANSQYPTFQSLYSQGRKTEMGEIVGRSAVAYWVVFVILTLLVPVVAFPILSLIKPSIKLSVTAFVAITAYLGLLNHHSMFCCFIISMNRVPYMLAYLISAIAGIILTYISCGPLGLGLGGMIASQLISQGIFNNWYWPRYVMKAIGGRYVPVFVQGVKCWQSALVSTLHNAEFTK